MDKSQQSLQNYLQTTKEGYGKKKALQYHDAQTKYISWIRFTTWRQKNIVNWFLKKINVGKNNKILDVPCGTGIMTNIISKYSNNLLSVDISDDMLRIAKNNHPNANYLNLDMFKLPNLNQTFDVILAIGIIHRLPKDLRIKMLKMMSNISNEFIVFTFTKSTTLLKLKRKVMEKIFNNYMPAPEPVKYSILKNELYQNGLSIIHKKHVFPFLSSEVVLMVRKIKYKNTK